LTNPEQNLVNPHVYHDPPSSPTDPELIELIQAQSLDTPVPSLLLRLSDPLPLSLDNSIKTEESMNPDDSWGEITTKGPVGVDWKFAPVVIDQTPLLPHLTLFCGHPALTTYR